jgi:hypothetical protein
MKLTWQVTMLGVLLACAATPPVTFADEDSSFQMLHCEGAIPAAEVKAGKVIFRYRATNAETITGFYARLTNCVGPRREPTIIGLRCGDAMVRDRVNIPVYGGTPLNMYTRSEGGRVFPPLDVGQEYEPASSV